MEQLKRLSRRVNATDTAYKTKKEVGYFEERLGAEFLDGLIGH